MGIRIKIKGTNNRKEIIIKTIIPATKLVLNARRNTPVNVGWEQIVVKFVTKKVIMLRTITSTSRINLGRLNKDSKGTSFMVSKLRLRVHRLAKDALKSHQPQMLTSVLISRMMSKPEHQIW